MAGIYMSNGRLVYSTNPELNRRCGHCKQVVSECTCPAPVGMPDTVSAELKLESAKRGGKKVTVIHKLPAIDEFLQTLTKELKHSCACGGTFGTDKNGGFIEIQGDCRQKLRELLKKRGVVVKG